jgi:hypothetical protein
MRLAVLAFACAVGGCGGVPFLVPDTRTAADHARAVEPKCKGFDEETVAPLLSPSMVDSVEAAYSHIQSGPVDREARLRGASIHVKPLPGFSREMLARNLECHQSRVMLGRVTAQADDPYVLADSWLDIDVDSEGDGFVILVRDDDIEVARRVLARAQRFAGTRAPSP